MCAGWSAGFKLWYEIVNIGGSGVYHCNDIILVNISCLCMSCAGWHAAEKSVGSCQLCMKQCHGEQIRVAQKALHFSIQESRHHPENWYEFLLFRSLGPTWKLV